MVGGVEQTLQLLMLIMNNKTNIIWQIEYK